jgi:hypothetical protein
MFAFCAVELHENESPHLRDLQQRNAELK